MPVTITQREFARRMGVSPQAVSKRVRAGRLTLAPDGRLDPVLAEHEWNATREPEGDAPERPALSARPSKPARATPDRSADSGARGITGATEASPDPAQASRAVVAPGGAQPGTYAQAKTADAVFRARLRQLEFEVKSGALVRADDVSNRWFERARAVRDRLLSIPVRLAPEVAAMTDIHEVRRRLDEEIRIAIKELVDDIR
jgi:transcriptional regulator with XRE-family HTH domain